MGVPNSVEDDPGHVQVLQLQGTSSLTVARRLSLAQSSAGVPGGDEPGDGFGASLALGDLDRDGYADLVVGAPGEDEGAGRVTL
ncbi:FG-GAP repeat protein, partial [Listeria monocytogenes]|uniref:FG-GAP repeat protein n=1 Tax=Listeria monocytogenes TaxID=1639 RepID=UPI002FDBABFD